MKNYNHIQSEEPNKEILATLKMYMVEFFKRIVVDIIKIYSNNESRYYHLNKYLKNNI